MEELIIQLILVLALSLPLWIALTIAASPVHPGHVVNFARRQGLHVTIDNGNHVIAYIATTRRWRAFGLAVGIVVSVVSDLPNFTISSLPLFAGWFVGALVAELRVLPPLPRGPKRAALVAPRKLDAYLSPAGRLLLPIAAALALLVGVVAPARTWPLTVAALAVAAIVWLIQRLVLQRSQPVAAFDLIAADDAIRSRSLHVLAGGGAALVLFLVLGQLARLGVPATLGFLGFLAVAGFGWAVATSRWLVLRVS